MAQIHYVVVYDTETEKWEIDDDSTIAKFDYLNCWLEDREEWIVPEDELDSSAIAKLITLLRNQ